MQSRNLENQHHSGRILPWKDEGSSTSQHLPAGLMPMYSLERASQIDTKWHPIVSTIRRSRAQRLKTLATGLIIPGGL
jgi:hypothetical protein